jgi:hypothetical protein
VRPLRNGIDHFGQPREIGIVDFLLLPKYQLRFLNFVPGLFPRFEAAVEVVDVPEVETIHFIDGVAAALTSRTMDKIRFLPVEGGEMPVEVGTMKIEVGGAGDVTC